MINRVLIRIKVVQTLYSHLASNGATTVAQSKKTLKKNLESAYSLYHALLWLPVDLTRQQELKLDMARNKYLPNEEELNPNMKFVDNSFVQALATNEELKKYVEKNDLSWANDIFLYILLDKITSSELYAKYMDSTESNLKEDADFWRDALKKIIFPDEDFTEFLESKSLYWNDDLFTEGTFVLKTINRWSEGKTQELMPMYKDQEDAEFGEELFTLVLNNYDRYNALIDSFIDTKAWDVDRIALMDRVILLTALAEVENFPSIPINVTLNEYIDIAKEYSGPKSGTFVNGILDRMIRHLRDMGKIMK